MEPAVLTQRKSEKTVEVKKFLKHYFGYDSFRGKQEEIIHNILEGNDAFVIMPTGAGKSLCYQLPATMQNGTALVISPLIALMKNQVDQMRGLEIEAGYLNSSMNKAAYEGVKQKARDGLLKMLYVAPESLARDEFIAFLREVEVSFVAIDEAHCISEWGHDFRPEYRRIRPILDRLERRVPIVALTATATPKVQLDVIKNLRIESANVFKSSFNRTNLYYEVRSKKNAEQELVRFIKQQDDKAGIVYCLSRKKVEEIARLLNVNGVNAAPYHAGLDSDTRSRHQDMFLNEDVRVIVATIAFGMGIDKPDVRFVVHYDVPKSIESYYQETGRAGRDGQEGVCVLFYDFNDVNKLEKFMKDKPLSEREAAKHLLYEMAAFCESGVCRRKMLLHYFGETFDETKCANMCDNCRFPKEKYDAKADACLALEAVRTVEGRFTTNHLVDLLRGTRNQHVQDYKHFDLPVFGKGADKDENHWKSVFNQLIIHDFLVKEVANYGLIRLADKGREWLENPQPLEMVKFQAFERQEPNGVEAPKSRSFDETLFRSLKKLRKEVAVKHDVPPYVVFQDVSLEEIAWKYPLTCQEFETITGVGAGKARKFSAPFIKLIKSHVEENGVERPIDLVVKTQGKKSADKLYIIQQVDRRIPLEEIASYKGMTYDEVIGKVEQIIFSGSRLNIGYYIDQIVDEDKQDEIYDYFRHAETDCLDAALAELGEDFSREEVQLVRAKFYSEQAN